MQQTVLQIPLPKELKESAEKAAADYGFSSLQELLRVFMKKLATKKINLSFEEEDTVQLSKKNEKRYLKALDDFKKGKNVYTAKNVDDFFEQLSKF